MNGNMGESERIQRVTFMDDSQIIVTEKQSTRAVCGFCVYEENFISSVMYPWHTIKKIEMR